MNTEKATLNLLRSELDAIDKEIRGAEKSVAKVAEELDRQKSHLKDLRTKRNKLRLDFKISKP